MVCAPLLRCPRWGPFGASRSRLAVPWGRELNLVHQPGFHRRFEEDLMNFAVPDERVRKHPFWHLLADFGLVRGLSFLSLFYAIAFFVYRLILHRIHAAA